MLSEKISKMLNDQVNLEFYSSNMYLQISAWCSSKGLEGGSHFFYKHSKEELDHMYKLFNYINDSGNIAIIGKIEEPPKSFSDFYSMIEKVYKHEQHVTKQITTLIDYCLSNKDYTTFNFLQWYVSEQHEEEKLIKGILDKSLMVQKEHIGIYMIDKYLSKISRDTTSS
jgi:ferritin